MTSADSPVTHMEASRHSLTHEQCVALVQREVMRADSNGTGSGWAAQHLSNLPEPAPSDDVAWNEYHSLFVAFASLQDPIQSSWGSPVSYEDGLSILMANIDAYEESLQDFGQPAPDELAVMENTMCVDRSQDLRARYNWNLAAVQQMMDDKNVMPEVKTVISVLYKLPNASDTWRPSSVINGVWNFYELFVRIVVNKEVDELQQLQMSIELWMSTLGDLEMAAPVRSNPLAATDAWAKLRVHTNASVAHA